VEKQQAKAAIKPPVSGMVYCGAQVAPKQSPISRRLLFFVLQHSLGSGYNVNSGLARGRCKIQGNRKE